MDLEDIVSAYAERHNLRCSILEDRGIRNDDNWQHHAYRVKLSRIDPDTQERFTITATWREGMAVEGSPTTRADEILYCLISDLTAYWDHTSAEDYAASFGIEDPARAQRQWNTLERFEPRIEKFMGSKDEITALLDQQ